MADPNDDITSWLARWSDGDPAALNYLIPLVYAELKQNARAYLAHERPGHTLQPTALLHEVYLRLVERRKVSWENRKRFFAFASILMRRILVEWARARQAAKRNEGIAPAALETILDLEDRLPPDHVAVIDVDQALQRLESDNSELVRIVELRFFLGLTGSEIAEVLDIDVSTVKRKWKTAKQWLARDLAGHKT